MYCTHVCIMYMTNRKNSYGLETNIIFCCIHKYFGSVCAVYYAFLIEFRISYIGAIVKYSTPTNVFDDKDTGLDDVM